MIRRFLKSLRGNKRTRRPQRFGLLLESLETRRVLSATLGTVTLENGELVICGDNRDNQIIVANTPEGIFVAADFLAFDRLYAPADVTSITITGEGGDDLIVGLTMSPGMNVDGGAGNDIIFGGGGNDILSGGEGDDYLYGRTGDDTLNGGGGVDRLLGHEGNDNLNGDDGDDFIFGNEGDDTIDGGAGDDRVFGDVGTDNLSGGDGDDVLIGADGDDLLSGDAGRDRIYGVGGNDRINGGDDDDELFGGEGNDAIVGAAGEDEIVGGTGDDILSGGDGIDGINGLAGNDVLLGGSGADRLIGEADSDALIAGSSAIENDLESLADVNAAWSASASSYSFSVIQSQLAPETGDDSEADALFGSEGRDVFFTSGNSDTVHNLDADEAVIGGELRAVDDSFIITPLGTLTTDLTNGLLANDVNPVAGDLTINTTPISAPQFGTVTINSDGTFTYVHTGSDGDVDTFVYEITNADLTTSQATVTIRAEVEDTTGPNSFRISEQTAANALVGSVTPSSALSGDIIYDFDLGPDFNDELQLNVDDHLHGASDAQVVLIEYADLQCPFCAAFRPVINELVDEFTEELLVVTRHLPLSFHQNAIEAALFAEAAGQQGQFDNFVDIAFERQSDWEFLPDPTSVFESYADELGLNLSDVNIAVNQSATAERVTRDFLAATEELNRNSTPSYFINGEVLETGEVQSIESFRQRINAEFAENTSPISLDRETGELRVVDTDRLDFETNSNISFDVIATDGTNSETITINIQLDDAADETGIPALPAGANVETAANGLQTFDLEVGDGGSPAATDNVRVAYTGYLPNGNIFDSNNDANFALTNLIQGFSEGVEGMQVGGTRRIIIPPDLGYGSGGNPSAGISGTDTIVFDVTLREIV